MDWDRIDVVLEMFNVTKGIFDSICIELSDDSKVLSIVSYIVTKLNAQRSPAVCNLQENYILVEGRRIYFKHAKNSEMKIIGSFMTFVV